MQRVKGFVLPDELKSHFGTNDTRVIRSASPYCVESFSESTRLTALVSCVNPGIMPLYRGQRKEWLDSSGRTLLLPSLYRWLDGKRPSPTVVQQRWDSLERVSDALLSVVDRDLKKGLLSKESVNYYLLARRHELVWAILQHYEYCSTPYLDVTQSLRMACMFAFDGASADDRPCVYMLGFPFVHDKLFRDSNAELTLIRLLSGMPPVAQRAYYQEGYLVGSELDLEKYTPKHDASQRIVAKFELVGNRHKWLFDLSAYPRSDIYSDDYFSCIKERVFRESGFGSTCTRTNSSSGNRFPDCSCFSVI